VADVATRWALAEDMTSVPADPGDGSPWEQGPRLAKLIRSNPTLVSLVGSEGRVLLGRLADPMARAVDLQATYTDVDLWPTARRLLSLAESAEVTDRSTLPGATVRHVLNANRAPSPVTRTALIDLSLTIADELLGVRTPDDPVAKLGAALDCLGGAGLRNCAGCGTTLSGRQSRWHSDACRKRSQRRGIR
jgi:hypothetical protein